MERLTLLDPIMAYFRLRMFAEALEEVEKLPPDRMADPGVLDLRVNIYKGLGEWQLMREVADSLVRIEPEEVDYWLDLAYATRRCRGITEAEGFLLEALKRDPEDGLIHYNLACYAAQQGNLPLARDRLATAISLEAEFKGKALTDPDLEPLRAETGGVPDIVS